MIKPFFDRRVEKRSLSGAKTRLFCEVYRKMAKSDGKFIFFSSLVVSQVDCVGLICVKFGRGRGGGCEA